MFFGRCILASFTLTSVVLAQTNTNPRIEQIVSLLDQAIHVSIPNIVTLQASHQANDATVRSQINNLVIAFNAAASSMNGTDVSSGSTTTSPTDDQVGVIFSECLSITASGLSGLTPAIVPSVMTMFDDLDPAVAGAVTAYIRVLPNGLSLVHRMLLAVSEFFIAEGFDETLAVLGF